MKKTKFFNQENKNWVLIDAKDKVLGRLSSRIARMLQGKHKTTYSPNFICGDHVVVINAKHIKFTGNKLTQKAYDRYSGYPGGIKDITLGRLLDKNPSRVLYVAVQGMIPKTQLGKRMMRLLKIYPDEKHEHQAQKPKKIEV
ncbi:MAG: 50S ribosomal protein L13 [Candidatus Omnitrophota bacterium]|nr:50S ribosomal protein L13 [Candidatus Omnitrophota bacterium]